MSCSNLFSMVPCKWLRQFCIFTAVFPGLEGLVLPSVVYVCAWGTAQAGKGCCHSEALGAVAWTQLLRSPQKKVSLNAVGQIIP